MPAAADEFAATLVLGGQERAAQLTRVKAVPAARALARRLGVDLDAVRGSGSGGLVTLADVIAAGLPGAPVPGQARPLTAVQGAGTGCRRQRRGRGAAEPAARDGAQHDAVARHGDGAARCSTTPTCIAGRPGTTTRRACCARLPPPAAPSPDSTPGTTTRPQSRRLFDHVDVGIAVDTPDGLIVPVMRDVGTRATPELRADLERLKRGAQRAHAGGR